jgi:hypothetical protein
LPALSTQVTASPKVSDGCSILNMHTTWWGHFEFSPTTHQPFSWTSTLLFHIISPFFLYFVLELQLCFFSISSVPSFCSLCCSSSMHRSGEGVRDWFILLWWPVWLLRRNCLALHILPRSSRLFDSLRTSSFSSPSTLVQLDIWQCRLCLLTLTILAYSFTFYSLNLIS